MKRLLSVFLVLAMMMSVSACGNGQDEKDSTAENIQEQAEAVSDQQEEESSMPDDASENPGEADTDSSSMETDQKENESMETEQTEQEEENNMTMNIQIGEQVLTATLVENSSTEALLQMLADGPMTIEMNDYASMEKVGPFPESLPRNDEQINTGAGDLILYQGNSFVIYYDTNSWNFTRLGRIDDMTQEELKEVLGSGSVTVVLSLPESES